MFSPKLVLSLRWVSMKRENDFFSRIEEEVDIFVEILVWNLYHLLLMGPLGLRLCSRFSSSRTRLNIYYSAESARPVTFAMVFLKPTNHPPTNNHCIFLLQPQTLTEIYLPNPKHYFVFLPRPCCAFFLLKINEFMV